MLRKDKDEKQFVFAILLESPVLNKNHDHNDLINLVI